MENFSSSSFAFAVCIQPASTIICVYTTNNTGVRDTGCNDRGCPYLLILGAVVHFVQVVFYENE